MVCCVWDGEGRQIENFNWLLLSDKLLHVYVLVVISTWAYLVLGVMAACVVVVIPSLTVIKHLREAEHLGTHGFLSTKKNTEIFINHYKHLKHQIFHFIRYKYCSTQQINLSIKMILLKMDRMKSTQKS